MAPVVVLKVSNLENMKRMLCAYSENRVRPELHSRPQSPRSFWPWEESRALAGPDFLSMRRVSVSYYQPIRFARFDGKFVNCALPVLDKARALDSCHRPEGSWALGTRMGRSSEIRHRNQLTAKAWEKAVQELGNEQPSCVSHVN